MPNYTLINRYQRVKYIILLGTTKIIRNRIQLVSFFYAFQMTNTGKLEAVMVGAIVTRYLNTVIYM